MRFTEEELRIAKSVDLCAVASHLGYTVRRIGKYHTLKEMDSIRIYNRTHWFRWSRRYEKGENGGSQIDFLRVFAGMDVKEAVFWLLDFTGYKRLESKKTLHGVILPNGIAAEERKEFVLPEYAGSNAYLCDYLVNQRGIAKAVVDHFVKAGILYEAKNYHNVVFVGTDASGTPKFASMRGVFDRNGKSFKCDVEGNDKQYGFHLHRDFCVYDDIRDKLIARGIPAEEIAYIHDAKTEQQKADLFDKVRSGEIRVLLGSTAKMGTGTNVQKKLIAVHDLDIPWRPADLEQRAGRIIRQGNENKQVQIFRYVTKGTFDAYSYQTLENKQKFISQIMTSKTPARKCEDVDQQALTYSEIKALCTGDERIKEKLMLENEVKELRVLAAEHRNTVFEMEDKIARFPEQEQKLTAILADLHTDREALRKLPIDPERKLPVF